MSSNDKYLGLKIPDNYDVRYKTFYADLYDINTKSYLGTCKVMNGVTVDYTRWKDLNNDPDLDIYVGERIAPAGKFKFTVVKKNDLDNNFQIDLLITGTGQVVINWGPEYPTETLELGDTPLEVTNSYDVSGEYQIEIDGSAVIDVSLAGTSTGQVAKVLDFGHIGLESVSLYVGASATYKKIPSKIPPTLKALPVFCKGMSGLTGTEFQDWDFSNLEDLTGFFNGATASTIDIDSKTFGQLTTANQMFANISASTITLNNCMFAELVEAGQLFLGPIGNTIELTNLMFSKLEHAEYWIAGGDHTTVVIDDVEMPALTTEQSMFGETNDCKFTVGTWLTPALTVSRRTFASYDSVDPASAKGVTITGWDMSSITSLYMSFCGHSDCVVSVDLSTCNVDSAHMVFYDSTNVTIVGNDLTIRDGGSLTDMLQSSNGTLDITIQNWTLEDNVTSRNAFGGTSAESGTLNFSGLTVGDNCTIDRACSFAANLAVTADDVTFGNGCVLASSFAYMYSGISLHAHNWTIGDGCDLTHMMSFHESTDVDALQWTIGNGCTLTNFAAYYDGTEKPGVRKFNSFTVGTGVTIGIDENLFAFGEQETLQTRDWTWGNEHIVMNMYSWRVGGSVDATGMSWGTGTQLARLCNFSTVERIDLTDWTFESVSTDYLLAHIPDTTEVVGVNDWDVVNITSLKGFVAHSEFTGLDVSNYDVSNCLDFTETFFAFRPMEDLVDFSTWNLSSGELFTSFAGSSGPIKFDMGHLQVHNATNMDMMFEGQPEVITNQDLTCWNVEKIPTQPPGWEQQAAMGGNRLPLWDVPMTDMSQRYHSFCRLPSTPDPLPDIDDPMQFKVESLDGESNTTVSLTVTSTDTVEVHWGDGQVSRVSGTSTVTHAYTDPDTHLVEVKGTAVTRVAKGTDNCKVTEIVSFGEIGLVSLKLSADTGPVTYTVLPNKLSSTMRDLTGLCRGMFGLTDETFAGWDFSKITNLTETWAQTEDLMLTFTGTALRNVTTMEGAFRGMEYSNVQLIDLQAAELTVTDDLVSGIDRSTLEIHRVSMPKLARTGAWLTGSTLSHIIVDALTLDTAINIDGWLSTAKNTSVEITALVTPILQTVGQIVGEHTSMSDIHDKPDIIFNGWTAAQLVSVGELFSNTEDGTIDVNLGSTFNVLSFTVFGRAFFGCKRTNISIPNLTFNAGTEIRQVFGDTEGCYVTATGWNIKDSSSMVSTFESDYAGNTFTVNGLTGGNGCTISNLSGESVGNTITINEATFGTGLVATNVFSANKGTLTADTWTLGEGANLAGAFSSAAGHGVTAIDWTVGDNADLTGIFMNMFATEASGKNHDFNGWSIGAGSVVTELCKSARDCRIDISYWGFDGNAELTEMCSGASNLYLTARNLFANRYLSLLNAFDSSHDCTLDAYQWGAELNVNLENAFSNATNLTLLEFDSLVILSMRVVSYKNAFRDSTVVNIADIRDWDLTRANDLSGMFASTNPLLPIDYIADFDLSNATNTSEMFWGSGSIMVDLGHWQVGSVTNMTNMFSVSAVSEYVQNFTCWNVRSIPTQPTGWATLVSQSLVEEPLWGQSMGNSTGRTHGFCSVTGPGPTVIPFPEGITDTETSQYSIKAINPVKLDPRYEWLPLLWDNVPPEDLWLVTEGVEKFFIPFYTPSETEPEVFEFSQAEALTRGAEYGLPGAIIMDFKGNTLEPFDVIVLAGSDAPDSYIQSLIVEAEVDGRWILVIDQYALGPTDWYGFSSPKTLMSRVGLVEGATKLRIGIRNAGGDARCMLARGFFVLNSEMMISGPPPDDYYAFTLIANPETLVPTRDVTLHVKTTDGPTPLPVTVYWGDGTTDTVNVVSINDGAVFTHTYNDDSERLIDIELDRSQDDNLPRLRAVEFGGDYYVGSLDYNGPGNRIDELKLYPSVNGTVERDNVLQYLAQAHYTFLEPMLKYLPNKLKGLTSSVNGLLGGSFVEPATETYAIAGVSDISYLYSYSTDLDIKWTFANFVDVTYLEYIVDESSDSILTFTNCNFDSVESMEYLISNSQNVTLVFDQCTFGSLATTEDMFFDCTNSTIRFNRCIFPITTPSVLPTDVNGNTVEFTSTGGPVT